MRLRQWWARARTFLLRPHRDVMSFSREVESAGVTGRVDAGMATIPAAKIVGSVGRAETLRSDFFYKTGKVTARFQRIGQAMRDGRLLPPVELYKARLRRRRGDRDSVVTEYYVVDGHHRVAMAKKLGQDYLDAHVVEYRVSQEAREVKDAPPAPPSGGHRQEEEGGGGHQVQG
jgi:hypothetical protein